LERGAGTDAAAANGSSCIALMCPRSPGINAMSCLDDLY
jgi:hypothetical protein